MKITKSRLQQIIKEEIQKALTIQEVHSPQDKVRVAINKAKKTLGPAKWRELRRLAYKDPAAAKKGLQTALGMVSGEEHMEKISPGFAQQMKKVGQIGKPKKEPSALEKLVGKDALAKLQQFTKKTKIDPKLARKQRIAKAKADKKAADDKAAAEMAQTVDKGLEKLGIGDKKTVTAP